MTPLSRLTVAALLEHHPRAAEVLNRHDLAAVAESRP